MARRIPKFPLKMANGANVRSIEELRSNADIDTIVSCYQNGTLSLWCRAFGYHDIPERFESINLEMVKSIFETLDIPVEESAIRSYIEEHGISVSAPAVKNVDMGEPIVDNEEVKKKLSAYVDDAAILSDYAVDVLSVNDEEGNLVKCKITIANAKTEQFTSFVLPYDVGGSYTKKTFNDDLLKKIAFVIIKLKEESDYLKLKNSRYAALNVGDTFEFGMYESLPIVWKVISNDRHSLFCISDKVLCDKKIEEEGDGNNDWEKCSLRRWLNYDFYNNCFTSSEKQFISKTIYDHYYKRKEKLQDYFYLLSVEEIEMLFDINSRIANSEYWTRTAHMSYMKIVTIKGDFYVRQAWRPYRNHASGPPVACGVRPVFTLKY